MAPATRSRSRGSRRECHFLKLPTELRLEIYEHTFPPLDADLAARTVISPPLLRTSKFIRHELCRLYFQHLTKMTEYQDEKNLTAKREGLGRMKEALDQLKAGTYTAYGDLDKVVAEQNKLREEEEDLFKATRTLVKKGQKYMKEKYEMRRKARRQARGLRDLEY